MITIRHAFVSPKADAPDNTLVRPSDWNGLHSLFGNISHTELTDIGVNTHAQLDTGLTNSVNHIADLANPHATDIENLGNGTLAELNAAITDANVDDSGDPRPPDNHAANHTDGTDDIQNATAGQKGLATAAQITKLDGIDAGAEVNNISDVDATDLTDAGQSALHYHDSDRARANHTGTQLASTISDFSTQVNALVAQAFLVASSDSTAEAQRIAGEVINTGNDAAAALETLLATYESIHILNGTYNFETTLNLNAGEALYGEGYNTLFQKANAAADPLILCANNCVLSNFRCEGVGATYGLGNGIDGNSASDCWFENLWVNDFGDDGIVNCFALEQCSSENNDGQGFENCFNMTNCNARNNGLNGFTLSGRMATCYSGGNSNDGYEDCIDMSSCYALGNGRHGFNDCLRVASSISSGHSGAGDIGFLNSEWCTGCLSTGNNINWSGCNFLTSCDGVDSVADDFSNCDYISSCRSVNAGDDAFYICDSMSCCYANGASDDGIFQCTRLTSNLAQNCGGDGFNDDFHMGFNESNSNTGAGFVSCNADGGDSIPVADTATGGYNDT